MVGHLGHRPLSGLSGFPAFFFHFSASLAETENAHLLEAGVSFDYRPPMVGSVENFGSFAGTRMLPDIRRTGPGAGWEVAHHHEELEFNLIVAGRGAYFLEDNNYELKPGSLVWILPHQRHRLMRGPGLDMWVGSLTSEHYTPEILALAAAHPLKALSAEDAIALDRLYVHLSQDADRPDVYAVGLQYAVRSTIHIARTSAGPPPPVRHPAVTQALSLLRREDEIANLSALASMCGVSTKYLGDLLVAQTGRGFVEWRNIARLERFQDIYPTSEDLLTAALAAGFGSYTQFHRVFQDVVGTTPGDWARKRDDTSRLALPLMSQSADQMRPGSQRLIWPSLADCSFAASDRWLAATIGNGLLENPESLTEGEPIPTDLESFEELRDLQPALVEELCTANPADAGRIREIFAHHDLFGAYRQRLAIFGADVGDLSSLATISLAVLSMEANHLLMPMPTDALRLRMAIRRAAAGIGSAAERREIAGGLVAQSMILSMASVGARGSGVVVNSARIADTVHEFAMRRFGIDLRQTPFHGPRSPLSAATAAGEWLASPRMALSNS
ncbi:helix-turn-helix domain-containing protein [Sandaracinobacter neustonicus]|nr:helix-turn-helix domain-containing protein [Sandaracinobacter neustonicus]